jgi:hypothetical protein
MAAGDNANLHTPSGNHMPWMPRRQLDYFRGRKM